MPGFLPPILVATSHAQGTISFSRAQAFMQTVHMRTTSVQSEVIFLRLVQVVAEQPVHAFQCHQACVGNLKNWLESGMFARAREIWKQILEYRFPSIACKRTALVRRLNLAM
jgi:hypothetical protein